MLTNNWRSAVLTLYITCNTPQTRGTKLDDKGIPFFSSLPFLLIRCVKGSKCFELKKSTCIMIIIVGWCYACYARMCVVDIQLWRHNNRHVWSSYASLTRCIFMQVWLTVGERKKFACVWCHVKRAMSNCIDVKRKLSCFLCDRKKSEIIICDQRVSILIEEVKSSNRLSRWRRWKVFVSIHDRSLCMECLRDWSKDGTNFCRCPVCVVHQKRFEEDIWVTMMMMLT